MLGDLDSLLWLLVRCLGRGRGGEGLNDYAKDGDDDDDDWDVSEKRWNWRQSLSVAMCSKQQELGAVA